MPSELLKTTNKINFPRSLRTTFKQFMKDYNAIPIPTTKAIEKGKLYSDASLQRCIKKFLKQKRTLKVVLPDVMKTNITRKKKKSFLCGFKAFQIYFIWMEFNILMILAFYAIGFFVLLFHLSQMASFQIFLSRIISETRNQERMALKKCLLENQFARSAGDLISRLSSAAIERENGGMEEQDITKNGGLIDICNASPTAMHLLKQGNKDFLEKKSSNLSREEVATNKFVAKMTCSFCGMENVKDVIFEDREEDCNNFCQCRMAYLQINDDITLEDIKPSSTCVLMQENVAINPEEDAVLECGEAHENDLSKILKDDDEEVVIIYQNSSVFSNESSINKMPVETVRYTQEERHPIEHKKRTSVSSYNRPHINRVQEKHNYDRSRAVRERADYNQGHSNDKSSDKMIRELTREAVPRKSYQGQKIKLKTVNTDRKLLVQKEVEARLRVSESVYNQTYNRNTEDIEGIFKELGNTLLDEKHQKNSGLHRSRLGSRNSRLLTEILRLNSSSRMLFRKFPRNFKHFHVHPKDKFFTRMVLNSAIVESNRENEIEESFEEEPSFSKKPQEKSEEIIEDGENSIGGPPNLLENQAAHIFKYPTEYEKRKIFEDSYVRDFYIYSEKEMRKLEKRFYRNQSKYKDTQDYMEDEEDAASFTAKQDFQIFQIHNDDDDYYSDDEYVCKKKRKLSACCRSKKDKDKPKPSRSKSSCCKREKSCPDLKREYYRQCYHYDDEYDDGITLRPKERCSCNDFAKEFRNERAFRDDEFMARARDSANGRRQEPPYERPGDPNYGRPRGSNYDRPRDQPYDRPRDQPYDRPRDQPYIRPRDQPYDRPRDQPYDKPRELNFDLPRDQPDDKPRDPPPNDRPRGSQYERSRDVNPERARNSYAARPEDAFYGKIQGRERDRDNYGRQPDQPNERAQDRPRERRRDSAYPRPDDPRASYTTMQPNEMDDEGIERRKQLMRDDDFKCVKKKPPKKPKEKKAISSCCLKKNDKPDKKEKPEKPLPKLKNTERKPHVAKKSSCKLKDPCCTEPPCIYVNSPFVFDRSGTQKADCNNEGKSTGVKNKPVTRRTPKMHDPSHYYDPAVSVPPYVPQTYKPYFEKAVQEITIQRRSANKSAQKKAPLRSNRATSQNCQPQKQTSPPVKCTPQKPLFKQDCEVIDHPAIIYLPRCCNLKKYKGDKC